MSGMGLAVRLGIDRKDADRFIEEYFQRFPKVLDYQQNLLANARKTGYVTTLLGRRRKFDATAIRPNSSYQQRGQAEREAINMEIQGSAADLMKKALLAASRRLKDEKLQAKMLLTVHDELVFEAPPEEVSAVAAIARDEMAGAMQLRVPLKVDVSAGPNWLDVEEING
jgi:DNA polymerase-1